MNNPQSKSDKNFPKLLAIFLLFMCLELISLSLLAGTTAGSSGTGSPRQVPTVPGPGDLAEIGDRVWIDVNGNGVQDTGEVGLDGVTVRLYSAGPDNTFGTADDLLEGTTTTGDNPDTPATETGFYLFENLEPNIAYQVEFVLPAGFSFTLQDQGGNTTDSDANPTTGRTAAIPPLDAGQTDDTWDAGLIQGAAIGDFVWRDTNENGIQDAGESGVAGVTVRLLNSAGGVLGTTTTDASGLYLFSGLSAGTYRVEFVLPTGFSFTLPNHGSNDAKDSDANLADGRTDLITLGANEVNRTWDAGLVQAAAIGDFVWHDTNNNGIQDAGESGIQGVTVNLRNSSGAWLASTTTDANGFYLFSGLSAGQYLVEFVLPSGYTFAAQNQGDDAKDSDANISTGRTSLITLSTNEVDLTQDAGLIQTASLGNFVWLDINKNGIQDGGEAGFGGVTVNLYNDSGTLINTMTTNSDGIYEFTNLRPGDYELAFIAPPGFVFTTQNQGNSEEDSDPDPDTGVTIMITLPPGQTDLSWDAGLAPGAPTNAELRAFTATTSGNDVTLHWETISEIDNLGFNLWRSAQSGGDYERVNDTLIPSQALGTGGASYQFTEQDIADGRWYYKLESISATGQTDGWHGPIYADVATPTPTPPGSGDGEQHPYVIRIPLILRNATSAP